MNEYEQIQHLRRLVWNARLARARLRPGDPLRRAHCRRLELFMQRIEARKIIPMPVTPYNKLGDYARRKVRAAAREVATAFGVLLCLMIVGCVGHRGAEAQRQTVTIAPFMPTLPTLNVARASVAPVKTNGVVTLVWSNGEPAETVIVNRTTGAVYPATTQETLTVGGLAIGSQQTFVATNTSGSSLPASVIVTPDTMRLTYQTWLYLTWPGPAGTLQRTTNMVIWQDVQPIATGGAVIITNQLKRGEFYRVKL